MSATITIPTDHSNGFFEQAVDLKEERTALQQISAFLGDQTSYSPAWTSSGSAPSLGNGTLTGYYQQIGKLTIFWVVLVMGSTTSFGSGAWRFSLPVTSALSGTNLIGSAMLSDSGVENRVGSALSITNTTFVVVQDHHTGGGITPTDPWTFKAGDFVLVLGWYWAA
jgi:hypothetical protein